jgi:hypothetical protein
MNSRHKPSQKSSKTQQDRKHTFDDLDADPESIDGDDRIDWDKKQKHKRHETHALEEVVDLPSEEDLEIAADLPRRSNGKKPRSKRRNLVFDEETGRVIVKRHRKRRQRINYYDDWED